MFKANLIENKDYYRLKNNKLLLIILIGLSVNFIFIYHQIPFGLMITILSLYIFLIALIIRKLIKLKSVCKDKQVLFGEQEISVINKNGQKEILIDLNKIEKLMVKETYFFSQEEIAENTKQNYIIIQKNKQNKRKLAFEIDSYYMINQLNQLISQWKAKKIPIIYLQ